LRLVQLHTRLRGDLTRLRQAFLNYLGNAIKFTENGTISLRAIVLKEDDTGFLVRFEVQDTGIGIATEKLRGLFESFEQADASLIHQSVMLAARCAFISVYWPELAAMRPVKWWQGL
jgi:K+-sensing histidine kinase KdpD